MKFFVKRKPGGGYKFSLIIGQLRFALDYPS